MGKPAVDSASRLFVLGCTFSTFGINRLTGLGSAFWYRGLSIKHAGEWNTGTRDASSGLSVVGKGVYTQSCCIYVGTRKRGRRVSVLYITSNRRSIYCCKQGHQEPNRLPRSRFCSTAIVMFNFGRRGWLKAAISCTPAPLASVAGHHLPAAWRSGKGSIPPPQPIVSECPDSPWGTCGGKRGNRDGRAGTEVWVVILAAHRITTLPVHFIHPSLINRLDTPWQDIYIAWRDKVLDNPKTGSCMCKSMSERKRLIISVLPTDRQIALGRW
jgi:hypothetical protein